MPLARNVGWLNADAAPFAAGGQPHGSLEWPSRPGSGTPLVRRRSPTLAAPAEYVFTDRERARGLLAIYLNTFLMYGGFFMVIPLISLHYGGDLGWSTATIGAVLAARQLVQQGLALIGGILADRLGAKPPIVAGLLIRAAGFGWMALADTPLTLLASAVLAATGGAFFEAPKSAAGAALSRPDQRARFYTTLGVAGNLGMACGPVLGAVLMRWSFSAVSLAAAAIFVVAAGVDGFVLPRVPVATRRPQHLVEGMLLAIRDRRFVRFTVLVMGFWFLAVQYTISLPLAARALGGTEGAAATVLFVYSAVTITVQYPLLRLLTARLTTMPILIAGMSLMAVGLGSVALAGSLLPLIACTVVFALGNLMAQPMMQTATARLVDPVALGSYFAVGAYALAIGGAVGNYSGGVLYEVSRRIDVRELPWLVMAVVGLLAAAGFAWFARHQYPGDSLPATATGASDAGVTGATVAWSWRRFGGSRRLPRS